MRPADHPAATAAAVLLCAYGCYSLWGAFVYGRWNFGLVGAAAFMAGAGVLMDKRWSLYLTYAVVALFVAGWIYGVNAAIRGGAWAGYRPLEAVLSLVPGLTLIALAVLCAWLIRRFFASPRPPARRR